MLDAYRAQDEATRRLISGSLDETLFVEAGAGTGKTRALVDRIVAHVLAGTPIERIAAVTFTEKAAAELRDRVRNALETSGGSPYVAAALEALDRAQISTIHAFAQSLLRTFSAQAGVDPDFDVQDEVSTERRMQERWRLHLERLEDDQTAVDAVDRILSLGLYTNEIERLAADLTRRPALAELLEANPPGAALAPPWPDLAILLNKLETQMSGAPAGCKLTVCLVKLLAAVIAVSQVEEEDRESALAAHSDALVITHNGQPNLWGGKERRDTALSAARDVAGVLDDLLAGLRASALAALMPFIVRFVRDEETARAREGALTFDDLILRVRDVVRDNPTVRRAFRERFATLLIDEFQDTDPLQMEIALAFATDPATGALEPGRLFVVGDPKQSIYRFRRADMEMYSRTGERIEGAGAASPQLALNQRSRGEVLAWVNKVFRPLIGEGDDPAIQPPYHDIHPDRVAALNGPGVAWMRTENPDSLARDLRREEAQAVAAQCRRAIEERWEVQDRDGTVRPATYRDIAVLIPRRILLSSLERSLAAAQVPYRIEGGSLIYRTQEVRDVINCLTAIDDPADEVAVVGALRSPAFACSDTDLAAFATSSGRFNYLRAGLDERAGPVADGLRILKTYHEGRHDLSLAGLVERVVSERGIVESGIIEQGDRNAFRRARFMIEQARSFEHAGPESVRAFVSWLERQANRMIVDHEGAGTDDDEDAVRIMTVHGAKGLEFPIVILAGLAAAPNKAEYPTYLADYAQGHVGIQTGRKGGNRTFRLGDYHDLHYLEQSHDLAEMDRLLYVAATRARDHLVLSLFAKGNAQSMAKRLIDNGALEHAPELQPPNIVPVAVQPFAALSVDLPPANVAGFADQRRGLVAGAIQRHFTSATAMKRDDGPAERRENTDETEPWARGRGATRLGRAVHAAIQSLPLDPDDATIEAFSRAQAVAEAIPHRTGEVAGLVRWVVRESSAWQRARTAPRALRETPFAVRLGEVVVEGFVDLLIETPDGIELIDWKTDRVEPGEVNERLQGYERQAGLYAHGIQLATGKTVTAITYVFASARVEISPGDPQRLAAAALEAIAAH